MEAEVNGISAIPTTYAGVRFRSRLEAKWAALFDLVGWGWDYEPLDLEGYVPDFVVYFAKPTLVEVKPFLWDGSEYEEQELAHARVKVDLSGWQGEALIIGASIPLLHPDVFLGGLQRIGQMRTDTKVSTAFDAQGEPYTIEERGWDRALAYSCGECGRKTFLSDSMSWHCRTNGCASLPKSQRIQIWDLNTDLRTAANAVQWRGR